MISSGKFPAPTDNTLYAIFLPSDSYTGQSRRLHELR